MSLKWIDKKRAKPQSMVVMNSRRAASDAVRHLRLPLVGAVPLSWALMWQELKKRDEAAVWAQFAKYLFFGLTSAVLVVVPVLLVRLYHPEYLDAQALGDREVLKAHKDVVMVVGFVLANVYAYAMNRLFVFSPGRHHPWLEFFFFLLISAVSFLAGKYASDWLIDAGVDVYVSSVSFIVASALINFVSRKYIVFADHPEGKY